MTSADEINIMCHYATATELEFLHALAATLPAGAQVMMLGAGPGVMAMAVLEGNPALSVWVIDHETCQWVKAHLEGAGLAYAATFIVGDSAQTAERWEGRPDVALLIVDADHSYEGVKRDMLAWLPIVAPGGYVFFHDYSASGTEFADQEQYPGVALAIGMYLPKNYTTVARVGTAIVFKNGA